MKLTLVKFVTAAEADMDPKVVQCFESGVVLAAGSKWELDVPTCFQWMPGGVHTINARYDGKPIQLTVVANATTAKMVQASFEQWTKVRPKQNPFGCVEHKEQEAALRLPKDIAAFEWKATPEPGVYCTALPTADGAKLVNGGMFSSWSPSFSTDAEYEKAKEIKGCMVFPKGVRGSKENPANVLGCGFSVGSLTNKPAFRDISPVRASEMAELEEEALITAAGTSEGVKKGWEHRKVHHGYPGSPDKELSRKAAMAASQEAHESNELVYKASSHADKVGTEQAHRMAQHVSDYSSFTHHAASEALDAHQNTHGYDGEMAEKGSYHRGQKFAKSDWAKRHLKLSKGGEVKASEETTDLDTVYANLAPKESGIKDIYARLALPENPVETLYDRLNAEANG